MSRVDGFFLVDKDIGVTSSNLVQSIKRKLRLSKLGHTGTLDSFAEGLMILPSGKACGLASIFLEMGKTYEASLRIGLSTDSGDPDGLITGELTPIEVNRLWKEDWRNGIVLEEKILSIQNWTSQEAPIVSALKIGGKRMSDLYRSGVEIEPRKRAMAIDFVKIISLKPDELRFQIRVSSGSYIRKIAIDLGSELGIPISLSRLIRTSIGSIGLDSAKKFRDLAVTDCIGIRDLVPYPSYVVEPKYFQWVATGRKPPVRSDFLQEMIESGESNFFLSLESGEVLAWARLQKNSTDWEFNRVFV